MNEQSRFFPGGTGRLFGVLHRPEAGNGWGVLFCYPFGEERTRVHRLLVNYARMLQGQGYTVLRFDYRGYGDSEGAFKDVTVSGQRADIAAAAAHLRASGGDRLALLGIRFGATLAATAAGSLEGVEKLVLWEPVVNVREYLNGKLRVNLSTQSTSFRKIVYDRDRLIARMGEGIPANIDGHEMGGAFYREACAVDLARWEGTCPADVLLVAMQQGGKNPGAAAAGWTGGLSAGCRSFEAAVVQAPPVWDLLRNYHPRVEDLFTTTSAWLAGAEGRSG